MKAKNIKKKLFAQHLIINMKYTITYLISKGYFESKKILLATNTDNVTEGIKLAKQDATDNYPGYQFMRVISILK